MMSEAQPLSRPSPVALLRVAETVLRRLVRFMLGQVTLVKLVEILRMVFIDEVEEHLRREQPDRAVSLSSIALFTGMDTRTLKRIRNSPDFRRPVAQRSRLLHDVFPGNALIDEWGRNPRYVDERGRPRPLPRRGPVSFESLFADANSSRGVTWQSLLEQLLAAGTVHRDIDRDTVTLVSGSYVPSATGDPTEALEMGAFAIGHLMDTVRHNVAAHASGEDKFYQRQSWAYQVPVVELPRIRSLLREHLQSAHQRGDELLGAQEESEQRPEQALVGFGLYYFEGESG